MQPSFFSEKPFNNDRIQRLGGVDKAAKELYNTFSAYSMQSDDDLQKHLSAEIHSLARMPIQEGDEVVLYSSETDDGQACARAVQFYLEQHGCRARITLIGGLQVMGDRKFPRQGVIEYVKNVLSDHDRYGAEQCVLKPTGSFKALVPCTVYTD